MHKIDYSALEANINDDQFDEALSELPFFLKVSDKKYLLYLIALSILYALLHVSGITEGNRLGVRFWYLALYLLSIGVWFVRQKVHELLRLTLKTYNFAKANGLYLETSKQLNFKYNLNLEQIIDKKSEDKHSLLFNTGDSGIKSNKIGKGDVFDIFDYEYGSGGTNNKQTHKWTVARYHLSRKLPHLVFDSTANNKWFMSNLPVSFKKEQRISLEGNFDEHFTLYAPSEYKIDTLSFITPEVMSHIINNLKDAEIEIIDDYLYIYHKGRIIDYGLKKLIEDLLELAIEIEDNIDNYRDDRLKRRKGERHNRKNIAKPGLRLKKTYLSQSIIFVLIAVFAFISPLLLFPLLVLYYALTKGINK